MMEIGNVVHNRRYRPGQGETSILSVVWLCVNLQPVREFCLFAAVVIVTKPYSYGNRMSEGY